MKFFRVYKSEMFMYGDHFDEEHVAQLHKDKHSIFNGYRCTAEECTASDFLKECPQDFEDYIHNGKITFEVLLAAYQANISNVYNLVANDFVDRWSWWDGKNSDVEINDTKVTFRHVTPMPYSAEDNRVTVSFALEGYDGLYAFVGVKGS